MADRRSTRSNRAREANDANHSDDDERQLTPPPLLGDEQEHVAAIADEQRPAVPLVDILNPTESSTLSQDRSGATTFDELEEAKRWLDSQRNIVELQRINEIRRRYEAGEVDALFEPTRATTAPAAAQRSPSLRPPTQKQPHEYTRKDRREYNRWKDDCDLCFQSSAEFFRSEAQKVNYALQFVNDVCRTVWRTEVQSRTSQNASWEPTWEALKAKMLRALGSPEERRLLAYDQLKRCQQRPGQSPLDLLDYIRGCWDELETTDNERQKLEYIGCLAPYIRQRLQSVSPELKTTVADVEQQASIIYRTEKVTRTQTEGGKSSPRSTQNTPARAETGGDEKPRKKVKKGRGRGNGSNRSGTSPTGANRTRPPITCYHCNKQGHIEPDCPTLDKPAASGSKDAYFNGNKSRESGKGQGRTGS